MQHIIDKYYSNLYTAGKDTLIIQLEKLSIQDNISVDQNTRYTEWYMACKEYTGGNNIYAYYGSVDTLLKEEYANIARFDLHKHASIQTMNFGIIIYYVYVMQ